MKQLPAKPPLTLTAKIGASAACLLFAIGFGAGGVVGIAGLTHHAAGWMTARSWQPIMAEVVRADLHTSRGRKSTTYRVEAQYRYNVEGIDYSATRIGYGDQMSDNIGSWHEDRYAELDGARRRGQRVLAWFNPNNPSESVIDRDPRWGMMLFLLPFASIFSAVSIGALFALVAIWRSK